MRLKHILQQGEDRILGSCTDRLVYYLAFLHNYEGGDAHYAKLACKLCFLIDVYLAYLDVGAFCGDLLNDGGYHTAGSAPGCPKVEQNRLVGIEDLIFKVICINIYSRHLFVLLYFYFVSLL